MKRILIFTAIAGLTASTPLACLPDRCEESSANIEVEVTFSGFDTSRATRLEFETEVRATSINNEVTEYYEKRSGSIAFSNVSGNKQTFVFNPGSYINQLPEGESAVGFRVIMRVYGNRAGHPDALLAEGQYYEANINAGECYIEKKAEVSGASTCRNKFPGDPCVSPSSSQPHGKR